VVQATVISNLAILLPCVSVPDNVTGPGTVVPMDELRATVRDGRLALEGSRVTRLPGSKRVTFPQQPERSDATSWVVFDDPAEGLRAVDELMRGWPFAR
jgi:hypothetical protein